MFRKLNAYTVYLIMMGALGLFMTMVFTVNMVYQVKTVGLTPLQLVLIGTTLEVSILLFEVPTGVVADVYSRRLSVQIGMFLIGLGFILSGIVPVFAVILLGNATWGLGYTFISGATDAWIADEMADDARLTNLYLRGSQIDMIFSLVGIPISVALATINIALPIVLGGVFIIGLGIFLVIAMPEHGFTPTPKEERESFKQMKGTLAEGMRLVKLRPIFLTILAVTAFYGMWSEGFDRLWTKHLLDFFELPTLLGFDSVAWFGLIGAVSLVISIGVNELFRRKINVEDSPRIMRAMFAINMCLLAGLLIFANSPYFALTLGAYFLIGVTRSLYGPLWRSWVNQNSEPKVRATMMSVASQMDAFGQIAGGPVVGVVGNASSTRVAISFSSMMLLPVFLLYTLALRRNQGDGASSVFVAEIADTAEV